MSHLQARLGDIAELTFGNAFTSADYSTLPVGPRLLRGDNIGFGESRWGTTKYWPWELTDEFRHLLLSPGDVVLAMDRPWISGGLKYATIRSSDVPALLVQRTARLRGGPRLDQGFLRWVVASREFADYIVGVQTGTTIPHISGRQIADFPVPRLPSIAEQRAISAILGALDDKIESNRRCVSTSNDLADSLFALLDASLEHRTLGSLREAGAVTFSDGYRTRIDQLGDPGLPILRVADMHGGLLQPTGDHVKIEHLHGNEAKLSAVGDVVISTKGTVGRVALISNLDLPVVYSPQVCFIRVRDRATALPSLIYRWARSSSFVKQAAGLQRQTDMAPYINLSDFALLEVPAGGTDNAAAAEIEQLDRLNARRATESRSLAALRDALLPELLSGRLRVPEARERVEAVV